MLLANCTNTKSFLHESLQIRGAHCDISRIIGWYFHEIETS